MTTFGWKRKAGEKLSKKNTAKIFSGNVSDDESSEIPDNVDWLGNFKRKRIVFLEDCDVKASRLKNEGGILAENDRFWEAITKWDEAIQLNPHDSNLYEMKAQALMQVNEVFPAVQAAEMAVVINPTWWVAYQTLGRAQLGIGEIKLAIKSFSKAVHLNPANEELWKDDLEWARKLLNEKDKLEINTVQNKAEAEASRIIFDENGFIKECDSEINCDPVMDQNMVMCDGISSISGSDEVLLTMHLSVTE